MIPYGINVLFISTNMFNDLINAIYIMLSVIRYIYAIIVIFCDRINLYV